MFVAAHIDTHVTAVRGVLRGAMALYLARYLNLPPARIPGDGGEQLDDLAVDPEMIGAALLDAFDRQRQVDLAARLVAQHLTLGHSPQALIAKLAHALLREYAGLHAYQMLEAEARQFGAWGDTDEGRHILIAVARYLAAHSPTERASLQTANDSMAALSSRTDRPDRQLRNWAQLRQRQAGYKVQTLSAFLGQQAPPAAPAKDVTIAQLLKPLG